MIKRSHKNLYLLVFMGAILTVSGCVGWLPTAHKVDIHQGNILDQENIDKLKIGMTREQIKYLLGSPVNQNVFHAERWDYLHYISKAGNHAAPKRITVFFANNVVSSIEAEYTE